MDSHVEKIKSIKIKKTIEHLAKNQMKGHHVKDIEGLHRVIKDLIAPGDVVAVGGSRTLFETGVIDLLRSGEYQFLDRYQEGLTPVDIKRIYRESFSANAFFMSSNAVTENGELYNVDGTGNRVAALTYGPDQVIVIVGANKIVKDLDAAVKRNRQIAAPANCVRLSCKTPCAVTGECQDCNSPDRICCNYVTTGYQRFKDRIQVIILDEAFGY